MLTHVAFDFDGTLADSTALVVELYNEVAREQGLGTLTAANLAGLRGLGVRERARLLGVPLHRLPLVMARVARRYRAVTDRVALHSGVPGVVRALREVDYRVHIVSTNEEANIRSILARYGLEGEIAGVSCNPRLFGKARLPRREGVPASGMLYVGDEARDVAASREACVRVVAVTWGVDPPERLAGAGPDALAHAPSDLPGVIRAVGARVGAARPLAVQGAP